MARIVITVEDKPNGGVSVTSDPNFETMMAMDLSGQTLTSAHGYAFSMLRHAREVSKEQGDIIRKIPRLK